MKAIALIICSLFLYICVNAQTTQYNSYIHSAEYGISIGTSHYFGDLDPNASLSHPKIAAGVFYQKQLSNYIGLRLTGTYAFLGYSDVYSSNTVQQVRNLSFNTNVWEASVSGYFNFFKFNPQDPEYIFTPYISLGVGIFSFNPYAYLKGQKIYLQPLGTEGQGYPGYGNPYNTIAFSIPVGFGVKYAINKRTNIFAELNYRFTTTKYLDDVSGVYHPNANPNPNVDDNGNYSTWYSMQDRSYELLGKGNQIGSEGKQRGNGTHDSFATFQIGISFNIQTYKCPQAFSGTN